MPRPFRFGLHVHSPIGDRSWLETARFVEDQGYSTLFVPDHFHHQYGPIAALAAAAAVTTELKVGALVFGNDYRHPVTLAKEMATLDALSGGRLEFGLGAGWMRSDYEQAGMPYERPGIRIERLMESLEVIRKCWRGEAFDFTGAHYEISDYTGHPAPHNVGGPPVIIGGGGPRMLGLAARHADIVAITANLGAGEVGLEALADSFPDAYDRKIAVVRDEVGDHFDDLELSSLTMSTTITDDRDEVLTNFAELFSTTPETAAQSPALLAGSVAQIVESLQERRERWGFNYVVIQQDGGRGLDAFSGVIEQLVGT